ncbi:replication protein [Saccharococcus caldoxylosilyticus]|uniref:replication protein n=1 Tax=Saccharococcus caldoxylosilyticus TaxID=81408 RepID=UPI0002D6469C|nr:replication protein [Parageobacillus caldoxylosilyticus]
MADVQLENGYTKIANKILERLALTKLSPIQYRLIFVIWRYTYGFSRKEHTFSLSFLSEATKYDQRQLQRELAKLEQRRIIVQKVQPGKPRIISFNKNYDEWLDEETLGNSTIGKVTNGNSTEGTFGNFTEGTLGNPTNQEIKNINKNLNKYKEDDEYTVDKILDLLQKSKILEKEDITEFLREDIQDVIDNFGFTNPEEMIVEAIKDAARGNGKTWKFVYNKLNAWRKQGIKTIEDLDKGDTHDTVHKHRRGVSRPAKEGKSYEQILREAEAARKAWGG